MTDSEPRDYRSSNRPAFAYSNNARASVTFTIQGEDEIMRVME